MSICEVCKSDIKWCPSCSRWLPRETEFWHRDSARCDGFTSWCKQCRKLRQNEKRYRMLRKIGALSLLVASTTSCQWLSEALSGTTPDEVIETGRQAGATVGGAVGGPGGMALGEQIGAGLGALSAVVLTAMGVMKARQASAAKAEKKIEEKVKEAAGGK